ncbi:MAG: DUF7134 domain-containing protein, partial [Pseudonocardiaceae bacterium]
MDRLRRRLTLRDGLLWFVLSTLVVLENVAMGDAGAPWWQTSVAVLAIAVAVLSRRSRPLSSLAIAVTLTLAQLLQSMLTTGPVAVAYVVVLSVLSYLAGRRADRVRVFIAIVVVGDLLLLGLGLPARGSVAVTEAVLGWLLLTVASLIFLVLPWLLGRYRRLHA